MANIEINSLYTNRQDFCVVVNIIQFSTCRKICFAKVSSPNVAESLTEEEFLKEYQLVDSNTPRCKYCFLPLIDGKCIESINPRIKMAFLDNLAYNISYGGAVYLESTSKQTEKVFSIVYGKSVTELKSLLGDYCKNVIGIKHIEVVKQFDANRGFTYGGDNSTFKNYKLSIYDYDLIYDIQEGETFKDKAIIYLMNKYDIKHRKTLEIIDEQNAWIQLYVDVGDYRINKDIVEDVIYNNLDLNKSVLEYTRKHGSNGILRKLNRRVTHCYKCQQSLDSLYMEICPKCGWIICPHCGACGCGYSKI